MIADIRWIIGICLVLQLWHVDGRVIDHDDDQGVFEGVGDEDPYDEEPFEEDRYEATRDRHSATSSQSQVQQSVPDESDRSSRECSSPSDCYPDECCHIGMQRFSEPSCRKLGAEGDFCRVGQEPVNRTLYYPNGEEKEIINAHILFCPCAEGLTCLRALCRPTRELNLVDKSHENTL